jgi:hypothetical protein
MAPTTKMKTLSWRAHLRPIHSVKKKQKMAPKKAPAWKAEVMLLEISLACSGSIPKSALKLGRAIVVPIKAES